MLKQLPEGITEIRCSKLSFAEFPTFYGAARLHSLIFSDNYICEASFEGAVMAHLKRLDLSRNHLSELPPSILQLNALEYLNVSNNFLSKLPEGLPITLEIVDAHANQISTLPSSFWRLSALEDIDLSRNLITRIEASVVRAPHLRRLILHHNPLSFVAPEVYGKSDWDEFDISSTPAAHSVVQAALPVTTVSPVVKRNTIRMPASPDAATAAERDALAVRLAAEQEARTKAESAIEELQRQLESFAVQPEETQARAALLLSQSQLEAAERRAFADRKLRQAADLQLSSTLRVMRDTTATHEATHSDASYWRNVYCCYYATCCLLLIVRKRIETTFTIAN